MGNETVEDMFRNIIRTTLTEDEFWKWIRSWKDVDLLCEDAEDWDTATKRQGIKELFQMFPILKKEFNEDFDVDKLE